MSYSLLATLANGDEIARGMEAHILLEAMRTMEENEELEYDGEGVSVTAEIFPEAGSPDLWGGAYTIWTDAGADGPYLLERDSHDIVVARVESIARDKGALS